MIDNINLWLHGDQSLFGQPNPLLILFVLLGLGFFLAKIAKKIHIPILTAQIIGGILIGKYFLNLFPPETYDGFKPLTNFALGFIGLAIGSHLDFWKLHNASKRLFYIVIVDIILTPTIVYFSLTLFTKLAFEVRLIIAAISAVTAPGSILHIVKEKRAKGILTKTILGSVALNNVIAILLFYLTYYFLLYQQSTQNLSLISALAQPFLYLIESLLIGGLVGGTVIFLTQKHKSSFSFLSIVILAIIASVGLSAAFHISGILPSMMVGIIIANYSKYKKTLFSAFKDIETEVFTLFFILAGLHLDFSAVKTAGFAGLVLVISRLIGKTMGPSIGAYLAKSTKTIKSYIGISLYPIAGVSIGLVLFIQQNTFLKDSASEIIAIVLTAVIINELIGPIFTGRAIAKSGEKNKNRLRLIDFIQEEFIINRMEATDKWSALEELAKFMHNTHKMHHIPEKELLQSIKKREKEHTTGIGDNLAIPHAVVKHGPKISGVIGVSKPGIDFDSIDDKPVHIIFMIATPEEYYDTFHVRMLSNIAKLMSKSPHLKDRIIEADSPEEIFEILQNKELEKFNPFFED